MKRHWGLAMGLFLVLSAGAVYATMDPLWMFNTKMTNLTFGDFQYCDTSRHGDYNCFALKSDQLVDTGSFDGSQYINFDYHFSSDTFKIYDEFAPTVVKYKDYRPGFAGFKTAWDIGMIGFAVPRYKYFVFEHKGLNPNHKVTVKVWYNDGACGSPSFCSTLGTFGPSNAWKLDTIVIPDSIRNKPDVERNTYVYYEFVFLINNQNSSDTTSGAPGNLKIDKMNLIGCNPIDTSPKPKSVKTGDPVTFQVYAKAPKGSTDVLTYQWKRNGEAIPGATSATYSIASASVDKSGNYTVDVTVPSSGNVFTSWKAGLTVDGIIGVINHKKASAAAYSIRAGSNGTVIINSPIQQKAPVTIGLYRIDGKTLIESTSRTLHAGKNTCAFGSNLKSSGVYVFKITGNDLNFSQEVLISK